MADTPEKTEKEVIVDAQAADTFMIDIDPEKTMTIVIKQDGERNS